MIQIVGHVLRQTHPVGRVEARALSFFGAQWCGAVEADLQAGGVGAAPRVGATDRAAYIASCEAALRFCGALGTRGARPSAAEIVGFAALCTPPPLHG